MKSVRLSCGCEIKDVGIIALMLMLVVNKEKKITCNEHGQVYLKEIGWGKDIGKKGDNNDRT